MPATVAHSNSDLDLDTNATSPALFMSLELSKDHWKLTFGLQGQTRLRRRSVEGGSLAAVLLEIGYAKQALKLPDETPVISCYEAGRDGFWLHRALVASGCKNHVLDASSLEVNRRQKQAKTDRIDGERLVLALLRHQQGDRFACRVVHVPAAEDEDARHLQRELKTLRDERTAHVNRMRSLLFALGIRCEAVRPNFLAQLETYTTGDGSPLPAEVSGRLRRDFARLELCVAQIRDLEAVRNALFLAAEQRLAEGAKDVRAREAKAVRLFELRGIGDECAWTFASELFGWRKFRNRRELGALLGLAPVPYASGQMNREQGLSKTGGSRLRALTIELAWLWLQYQPDSALTKWYVERFAAGNKRVRRIGIVALARKLMVALWKYVEAGEIPQGAILKTPDQRRNHRRTPGMKARAKRSTRPPTASDETAS